jgi:threonine synthase
MEKEGRASKLPVMAGFQAEGASPMVNGKVSENPQTVATAIRIGNPANWEKAEKAKNESGGFIDSVTDDEILAAYKELASREGVFAEPASAASLAGVVKSLEKGVLRRGTKVVCVLTGNGLKDPDTAVKTIEPPADANPDIDEIMGMIGKEG